MRPNSICPRDAPGMPRLTSRSPCTSGGSFPSQHRISGHHKVCSAAPRRSSDCSPSRASCPGCHTLCFPPPGSSSGLGECGVTHPSAGRAEAPRGKGARCPVGCCRLLCSPWSITHRLMLLLVSFGDFLGTTLMSRLRALSRPCAEAPSRASSSRRCLISSFRSLEESFRRDSAQQ